MRMTVAVRTDYAAAELRRLATTSAEPEKARRLLALALVLEGASRADAARSTGMDRQTLRDWVHRFNEQGLDGLVDRQAPGRQRRLSSEQLQEIAGWLEAGPDQERDGVVRWRLADLCARVEQRFGIGYQERGMGKIVRFLGFRRISARPAHPDSDPQAQLDFKKNSRSGSPPLPATSFKASRSRSGSKTKAASARRAT
jgi:putative transposase